MVKYALEQRYVCHIVYAHGKFLNVRLFMAPGQYHIELELGCCGRAVFSPEITMLLLYMIGSVK